MTDADAHSAPQTTRVAQLVVALQAAALAVAAVGLLVELLISTAHRVWIALSLAGLAALAALVLGWCSRALGRAQLPARTPIVLIQLLCLPVGYGLIQGSRVLIGAPIIIAALAVLGCLASPASRDWLT